MRESDRGSVCLLALHEEIDRSVVVRLTSLGIILGSSSFWTDYGVLISGFGGFGEREDRRAFVCLWIWEFGD
ncbi:hypothetical protein RchiOBHm_Chr1g0320671 [Rosa chinensis]|uniref:Uncharacterized protein n=1 Tax=Rosa chinensis TaxID=74649 RepID=A0A2P6S8Q7_ROSCH|nr:hypothetical protein RchiOBHm_Chr1g0320671 [Rosa chinensis]